MALKLAKCNNEAIRKAFQLLELAMEKVPEKDAIVYMKNYL
jgi:hypothetical protein